MTAPNHALTGAFIGLTVTNPALALPLAFASHFVLDAIPHFDFPADELTRIRSKQFFYVQIVAGAALCFALVVTLAVAQPTHWLLAAFCAFLAASPDLLAFPKFVAAKRHNKLRRGYWFDRFHHDVQRYTGPQYWWVEALWFVGFVSLVGSKL